MKIEKAIGRILESPKLVTGTIQIFGEWFGRPMDNWHQCIKASYIDEILELGFSNNETCIIRNPIASDWDGKTFSIKYAEEVNWTWYYYGKPETIENIRNWNFKKTKFGIEIKKEDIKSKEIHSKFIEESPTMKALIIWSM